MIKAGNSKPSILFIMADSMREDFLGCSCRITKTPNLDRLAYEGIRFSNCITNSPVCMPARVALAVGLYPHNTGLWENSSDYQMPSKYRTWMSAIHDNGLPYRTYR